MFERQTKKLFLAAALGPLAYISHGALITAVALISIALCSRSPRPPSLYKQLRPPKAPLQQPITIHSTLHLDLLDLVEKYGMKNYLQHTFYAN